MSPNDYPLVMMQYWLNMLFCILTSSVWEKSIFVWSNLSVWLSDVFLHLYFLILVPFFFSSPLAGPLLACLFYFAYFDRQQWFLGGNGGFSRQKFFWGPNWAHFWHVSKLLLSPNSLPWLLFTSFFLFCILW